MKKTLIVLAAALVVVAVGWVAMIGTALAWSGVAMVKIAEDGGMRMTMPVPMAAFEAAGLVLDLSGHVDADVHLDAWGPLVEQILAGLDDCPDAILVEVEDGAEHVLVEKRDGALIVHLDDGRSNIEFVVPTRSVRRVVGRLVS